MIDSKALKDFPETKRSKLYGWWIESKLGDWYYEYTWKFFGRPISRIKKLYGWYVNVFKNDYDFDGHCLFAIIEYKLKRIEKVLIKGHAIQEAKDMKALKLAIKLAGRLKEDKYEIKAYDRIDQKYGELKTWFTDCTDRPGYSTWNSSRPKANTTEEKEELWTYTKLQYELAEAKSKKEELKLYNILHKYLRHWWD